MFPTLIYCVAQQQLREIEKTRNRIKPMPEDIPDRIRDLTRAVEDANLFYNERNAEVTLARHSATEALNRLNKAQKELDEAIFSLKAQAPKESDWMRRERERQNRA